MLTGSRLRITLFMGSALQLTCHGSGKGPHTTIGSGVHYDGEDSQVLI